MVSVYENSACLPFSMILSFFSS